ncbi:glycosyltransferase [Dermacoccus sp. Tok2021]|uniref:glycosyltransferase n=1 Tax=Dermacoccus sp. Tok2021 TaxID=2826873 RepID=UPI001CA77562|nr:glycosyltransferase [Dermacoccus sp. Tok2021]MBZ4496665.1 glycosyltransferase [Dermacoccus sp. Tok2021]
MKALSRVVDVATVVVPGDVGPLHHKGFRQVALVRNAPSSSWRSPWEPLPTGPTRFVLVGSIFEGRGIENLIQAAHLLQDDIQIDIYGRGRPDYMQALKEMSATGHAEDVINWRGEIAPDQVSATYLSAHVGLVLYDPTIPGNDGLSNKIMECISTGRPVLAGDLPENHAFVSQHGVGWLTDLSPDNMARTMREIHASPDSLKANADRAREFGRNELTWESEFDNLLRKLSN